jgi:hypothetical protein
MDDEIVNKTGLFNDEGDKKITMELFIVMPQSSLLNYPAKVRKKIRLLQLKSLRTAR